MKKAIAVFALAAAASLAGTAPAEAQIVRGGLFGGPRVFTGPGGPVALTPGYGYPAATVYAPGAAAYAPASAPYVPPYSYYAALPTGRPARVYVGYGRDAFPYYGHPYGHPSDPWSWTSLSGGHYGVLARYYYPPLG